MSPRQATPRRVLPGSPFNVARKAQPPAPRFSVDDRVNHDSFGLGTVVATEGETAVVVDFGTGVRRIPIPDTKLIRL
jgi:hypothetical protein